MKLAILIPKYGAKLGEGFSKQERLQAEESPGRYTDPKKHGYQSAATWITSMIDRRLGIMLCTFCRHKFNPKKHKYRRFYCVGSERPDPYRSDGVCDDCKQDTRGSPGGGTYFIAEEVYAYLCHEPEHRRRPGRWTLNYNPFNRRLSR